MSCRYEILVCLFRYTNLLDSAILEFFTWDSLKTIFVISPVLDSINIKIRNGGLYEQIAACLCVADASLNDYMVFTLYFTD